MSLMSKYKAPSMAQLWARDRNASKWRLMGAYSNLKSIANSETLTAGEYSELNGATNLIQRTLKSWKATNKLSKHSYMAREEKNDKS